MTHREHLVYMANQIARNFATMSEADAAAATADHVATFWDPRMKGLLLADDEGLGAVALAAAAILKRTAHPPHQTQATAFDVVEGAGPSDAG